MRVVICKAKPGTALYDVFFKDVEKLEDELDDARTALAVERTKK